MDRKKKLTEWQRVNGKFSRKYQPKIYKAIKSVQSSLIDDIEANGTREAMNNLAVLLMNDKLAAPLSALNKEVGLYHARQTYREVRADISQKFLGRSEIWLQEITNYLQRHLLEKAIIRVTETTRQALMKILDEGLADGLGEYEIIKLLEQADVGLVQSQRIVRTEVNMAANTGSMVAAKSFNIVMTKEWVSHRDMRTRGRLPEDRKDHYHMDGQTVGIDDKFSDPRTGELVEHPSDPKGSAAMVINCRCTFVAKPKRDEQGRLVKK